MKLSHSRGPLQFTEKRRNGFWNRWKRNSRGENADDLRRIAGLLDRYNFRVRYSGDMFRTTLSDRRLLQALPNIDANLLNHIVPIAEPIPLWRVRLCSACHVRRPGRNHYGIGPLKASDELPPLPAVSLPFAH